MLFTDDAAVAAYSPSHLQFLTTFGLTISLKKTKVLAQATISPKITMNNYELEVVDKFIYIPRIYNK